MEPLPIPGACAAPTSVTSVPSATGRGLSAPWASADQLSSCSATGLPARPPRQTQVAERCRTGGRLPLCTFKAAGDISAAALKSNTTTAAAAGCLALDRSAFKAAHLPLA